MKPTIRVSGHYGMRPGSRHLDTVVELPVGRRITYHSIIGQVEQDKPPSMMPASDTAAETIKHPVLKKHQPIIKDLRSGLI